MKQNKTILHRLISCVFSFLLTLLFIVLFLCIGFSFGLFNGKSITRAINQSNYYNKVYHELNRNTETLITDSGLPVSVLTDVITLQRVYIGGKNYIESSLRGEEVLPKTDKLKDQLTSNIKLYLQEEGINTSEELTSQINDVISIIETEYTEAIQLKLLNGITDYRDHFFDLIIIILPVVIVLIGILCYFLIRIQKYQHKGVRYIVYGLMASSLLTIIAALYLLITKQYSGIDVAPGYYKDFVTEYLRWDMMIFIYVGGIGLTISIALISLISYLKNGIKNS